MGTWGYENGGVYRANTREDDNSSSLRSDFPEPPNRTTFRRRLRLWSRRMERKALSEFHGSAISARVFTVTASTRHPQLCALLRGSHMERHSRFRELFRHRGQHSHAPAYLGRSSRPKRGAVDCFV